MHVEIGFFKRFVQLRNIFEIVTYFKPKGGAWACFPLRSFTVVNYFVKSVDLARWINLMLYETRSIYENYLD
jgi:hypothetical protein